MGVISSILMGSNSSENDNKAFNSGDSFQTYYIVVYADRCMWEFPISTKCHPIKLTIRNRETLKMLVFEFGEPSGISANLLLHIRPIIN